jgi:uncharacterized membrane protein HdeD (DUF308 family)
MELETQRRPWWMTLILGILAVVVGAILLWGSTTAKENTWLLLVEVLGFYWLIRGVMDIVSIFIDHTGWGWKLFFGIVSILAGSAILMYPVAAAVQLPEIFVWVLGFWALISGIFMLLLAFRGGGWGPGILGGLEILFGLIILANYNMPGAGLAFIWSAAVVGLIGGAMMIFQAFRDRSASA